MICRNFRMGLAALTSAALLLCASPSRADDDILSDPAFVEILRLDKALKQNNGRSAKERNAKARLVRRLQAGLQSLGYYDGQLDGNFGPRTVEALGAYQRERGLYPTTFLTEYDIVQIEAEVTAPSAETGEAQSAGASEPRVVAAGGADEIVISPEGEPAN